MPAELRKTFRNLPAASQDALPRRWLAPGYPVIEFQRRSPPDCSYLSARVHVAGGRVQGLCSVVCGATLNCNLGWTTCARMRGSRSVRSSPRGRSPGRSRSYRGQAGGKLNLSARTRLVIAETGSERSFQRLRCRRARVRSASQTAPAGSTTAAMSKTIARSIVCPG
jgi:hypothetical protein